MPTRILTNRLQRCRHAVPQQSPSQRPRELTARLPQRERRHQRGVWAEEEITDSQAPPVSDPALHKMTLPVVQHVAALTEGAQIIQAIVGRVTVKMRGSKHDARYPAVYERSRLACLLAKQAREPVRRHGRAHSLRRAPGHFRNRRASSLTPSQDAQLLGITLPWRWHLAAAIKTTGRLTSYAATLAELRHWRNAQSGKATGVVVPI